MLQTEQWMDIQLLYRQLGSIRAVVRETGFSRNTVRKMLRSFESPKFKAAQRKTGVDDFKDYLTRRYNEHGLSAVRLLDEIRPQGFTGSIHMIRRFLKTLRPLRVSLHVPPLSVKSSPPSVTASRQISRMVYSLLVQPVCECEKRAINKPKRRGCWIYSMAPQ